MKYTVFNCSPKLGKNNTQIMLDKFIEGLQVQGENKAEVFKLNQLDSLQDGVKLFEKADGVIIAFPLYCYAMPGGLKLFIEALEPLCDKCAGKKLGFIVQYGFREAIHARPIEKYLIKLAKLLGCDYVGTVIKGGCDALTSGRGGNTEKLLQGICEIGKTLAKQGRFDQQQLDAYSAPENEQKHVIWLMKLICKLVNKFYWGATLKKNGVPLKESYTRPYIEMQ